MKRYKITYNYFLDTQCTKKRIAIKILEAYDKDHAIQRMAMQRKLILKVETI
jgi:hypothetical protein